MLERRVGHADRVLDFRDQAPFSRDRTSPEVDVLQKQPHRPLELFPHVYNLMATVWDLRKKEAATNRYQSHFKLEVAVEAVENILDSHELRLALPSTAG